MTYFYQKFDLRVCVRFCVRFCVRIYFSCSCSSRDYSCVDSFIDQVNNLPVNILPVAYGSQNHGQSSYSSDDLPKTVVMTLNQGSSVKSMDFHPVQQILLLGRPLICI